ncbi:MAG TPA: hypothetical protein VK081_11125 [Planctomycetota bacterium]|nr:hypothetical protein [Planctomycetota bacterium]
MRLDHPIFQSPNHVRIPLTEIDTPPDYAHYATAALPERLTAWQVFEKPAAGEGAARQSLANVGLVSDGFGFEDLPDSEWIASGINSKGPQALALGRQGNYFLWGFAADPTLMTPSARDVFVNAICWMKQFDGQRPLVTKVASPREWLFVELWVASQKGDRAPAVASDVSGVALDRAAAERYFGRETVEKHGKDYATLKAWLVGNLEAITSVAADDGGRRRHKVVDEDVVALGVSNRRPEFFDRVLARWREDPADELCTRVLARYVPDRRFASPEDLEQWLAEHRGRLRFTDFGGYRWVVVPREAAKPASPTPAVGAGRG